MKTQIVELLINVTQDTAHQPEGETRFIGEYVMRAVAADGTRLSEAHVTLPDLDTKTSDGARLQTLAAALTRLHSKLHGDTAHYVLQIAQSSKNVDGWLSKGWKRRAPDVIALTYKVDTLLTPFVRKEFVQLSRAELDACIESGEGVMLSA